MPPLDAHLGSTDDAEPGNGQARLLRFLRYSHIFASAVREIIELKYLREATSCHLTLLQFNLLKLISLNGRHQVGEIAHFLGVSPPAATKNIDKLERLGLVVRTPSTGDRRATLLSSSPKGRRLVRKYEAVQEARLAPVLKNFEDQEIDRLAQLLERFSVSLLQAEQGDRSGQGGHRFCLRCAAYIEPECPVGHIRGGCPYQQTSEGRRGRGVTEEVS